LTFDPLTLRRAYTEYLGKLGPLAPGMKGTDLGISFVRDDRLVFLFGDTMAAEDRRDLQDVDFAATSSLVGPAPLEWIGPLRPPGLALPRMGVPVEGLARDDDTFVFFATDFDDRAQAYATSALTKTRRLALDRLEVVHRADVDRFANLTAIIEGDDVFLLGAGNPYRKSAISLARVPLARIEDRDAWRIDDDPIVDVRQVGELSARRHPTLPLYLLTYNSGDPRGVVLRLARSPAGPWIDAGMLYVPSDGYEKFIHAKESAVGHDDGLSQPGDEETWGGEYGPYLVPSWFVEPTEKDAAFGITFTLSSWNPYCVHVLRTWLVPEGQSLSPRLRGLDLPPPRIDPDGRFTIDAKTTGLRFTLGPRTIRPVTVVLRRGSHVLRASRSHRWRSRLVEWNLERYRGDALQLDTGGADADVEDLSFF
jgi:hypothetical protein